MAYEIIFSARAESDLQAILEDDSGRYSPSEQLTYILGIRRLCFSLNPWPKRSTPLEINGRSYRRLIYKAHTIFFRVLDHENRIVIDAVLHGRRNFKDHL